MKYKLACFDLDGTIIDETESIWQTIHDHLQTDKNKRKQAKEDFFNKKMSYEEWARHDVELWKEVGATKKEILESLGKLRLMKGARETLDELKKKGLKLAIISGSLNFAIETVLPDYKEFFDHIFMNEIYFDDDGKIKKIRPTKYDMIHKATALRETCKRENIKESECIFVGDHHNDIQAAEAAGLGISFNSKSKELDAVCDVKIEEKNLKEILKFIMS